MELVADVREDVIVTVEIVSFMKKRSWWEEVCRFEVKMRMYIGTVRSVRTSGRMRARRWRSLAILRRDWKRMRPRRGHGKTLTSIASSARCLGEAFFILYATLEAAP